MTRIWWFAASLPRVPWVQELGRFCRFTNKEEMIRARSGSQNFSPDDLPIAHLELAIEQFSLDCFCWEAYILVSQDLRKVIALDPPGVQYFPVDASLSAPLPRSKNYMIMRIPASEDMSDLDRSDYHYTKARGLEGVVFWNSIAIKRDFEPKNKIFRDHFFDNFLFCTDKFAVSILRSRCTGMRFYDFGRYRHRRFGSNARFRSLRGLEEETLDRDHQWRGTRLVKEIA